MNEALKGAKQQGGLTLGIMPTDDKTEFSEYVDIPIITTMEAGRNYIEILTRLISDDVPADIPHATIISLVNISI